jgi:septal ring factor EnvC (AmiA/AmiB activator)
MQENAIIIEKLNNIQKEKFQILNDKINNLEKDNEKLNNNLDNIVYKLDNIVDKLDNIVDKLNDISKNTNKMDSHIDFVDGVYSKVQRPFHTLMNIVSCKLLFGRNNTPDLNLLKDNA